MEIEILHYLNDKSKLKMGRDLPYFTTNFASSCPIKDKNLHESR